MTAWLQDAAGKGRDCMPGWCCWEVLQCVVDWEAAGRRSRGGVAADGGSVCGEGSRSDGGVQL
jgi:hypothetical protein